MQNIFKTTVTCPKCGAQSEFTIYNFVNEKEQPGVGTIIGDFDAHLHICPKCNTRVAYPYPTIYEDLGNNVVFAYGTSKEEAKQIVIEAQAEADSQKLEADAQAYAIQVVQEQLKNSPDYIDYLKITNWNGVLPQVMSDGINPFLVLDTEDDEQKTTPAASVQAAE